MPHAPYRPSVAQSRLRDRLVDPFVQFAESEANSGILLLVSAILATTWATAAAAGSYEAFWDSRVTLGFGGRSVGFSLRQAVQDGLMVPFFLLMGLEIKRELLLGELRTVRRATLPAICALGGMLGPALIYFAVGGDRRGFAIPMATDIAFALGALSLLGKRVPAVLKVFLAAIAIVDDLGAVVVIALFYSHGISTVGLGAVAAMLGVLFALNRLVVRSLLVWALAGIGLWLAVLFSGVHATVAGVLIAAFIPARTRIDPVAFRQTVAQGLSDFDDAFPSDPTVMTGTRQEAIHAVERATIAVQMPLERMEDTISPWVAYGVMPLFALASAGIDFRALHTFGPVGVGVAAGLLLGKPIGIVLSAWIAVRLKAADLPKGITWSHVGGVGALTGIGFTMALFISELAFGRGRTYGEAQAAVTAASVIAGVVGMVYLSRLPRSNGTA